MIPRGEGQVGSDGWRVRSLFIPTMYRRLSEVRVSARL